MAPLNQTTVDIKMNAADVDSKPSTAAWNEPESEAEVVPINSVAAATAHEPESEAEAVPNSSVAATAEQAEQENSKVAEPSCSKDIKWRAAFRIVTDVPAEKLWAVAKDYCNLKWFSLVTICEMLKGDPEGPGNTVGTVRHCVNENGPWFSDEELVAIDHEKLTLTYKMVNSSLGWLNYQATLSVGNDQALEGKKYVELRGEQSARDNSTEEEAVQFMKSGYGLFVTELEVAARTT